MRKHVLYYYAYPTIGISEPQIVLATGRPTLRSDTSTSIKKYYLELAEHHPSSSIYFFCFQSSSFNPPAADNGGHVVSRVAVSPTRVIVASPNNTTGSVDAISPR